MKTKLLPYGHIFFSSKGSIFSTIPKKSGAGISFKTLVFKFKILECVHDPQGWINTQFELKFLL